MRNRTDGDLWRIELRVPAEAVDAFVAALEGQCLTVSWFGGDDDPLRRIEGVAAAEPDRAALEVSLAVAGAATGSAVPVPHIELLPGRDWVAENVKAFPPVEAGRFFIHCSHFEGVPPAGRVAFKLDPGAAFGSGEHASTAGCLMALSGLKGRRFRNPLDLGCGSGVLAMAIARTWGRPVLATDIDPVCLMVTRANARANRLAHLITVAPSRGYVSPAIRARRPFDLIVANILARPLRLLARDLAKHLDHGGIAVLSGFVATDAPRVFSAHRRQGLRFSRQIITDGWATLVLER